ncbi:aquaporin, partial [Enterobacter hormaechei]|uniref:aquaporin n=1 Tax=Enterobacter hormaechei TaxID=158836 RepID=UPI00203F0178
HIARGSVESLQLASIFSTYPAASLSIWHAALVEVVITSMLMGMIMALTDDGNGVPKGPLAPLLIGLLVALVITLSITSIAGSAQQMIISALYLD